MHHFIRNIGIHPHLHFVPVHGLSFDMEKENLNFGIPQKRMGYHQRKGT